MTMIKETKEIKERQVRVASQDQRIDNLKNLLQGKKIRKLLGLRVLSYPILVMTMRMKERT